MDKEKLMLKLFELGQEIDMIMDKLGRIDDVLDDRRLDNNDMNNPGAYSHLDRAKYLIGIVESELEGE